MADSPSSEPRSRVLLETPRWRCLVRPDAGALIARLDWRSPQGRWLPVLHAPEGAVPTSPASPNLFGCWPMLPYANRAFDAAVLAMPASPSASAPPARFPVPVNEPGRGGAIHGFGWQAAWAIDREPDDDPPMQQRRLVLTHAMRDSDHPWRYTARMEIVLDDAEGLAVTTTLTSTAGRRLPYGLGLHPWLVAAPDTVMTFRAGGELALGAGYRGTGRADWVDGGPCATGAPGHDPVREIVHSVLDWEGTARFDTPSLGLSITLSACEALRHPVVWAPPGAPFLCFEPQSHAIGAPSLPAVAALTPLAWLAPGESLSGTMRLAARPCAAAMAG
jgi:aldose 1-epimerase